MSAHRRLRLLFACRGRLFSRALLITTTIVGVVAGSAAVLASLEPEIWPDQAGYPAGAVAGISGEGFLPFETVVLEIVHADGTAEPGMGHEPFAVSADPAGVFVASWSINPADTSGDDFVLRATGQLSGLSAENRFRRSGSVTTDKFDYQPGEVTFITGYGFGPGEVVTIVVAHADGSAEGAGHLPFYAMATEQGHIAAQWFVNPDDSFGSRFLLSAVGDTTGRTATATFVDAGSISLSALNAPYTQDFDTLAATGTANTGVPTGWAFVESGTNANTTYRAGTGSDNTGDTYSFGAAGSGERAFGGLRSGSLVPMVGASFTNNTGSTIASLALSYTGEQWRLGQNTTGRAADRIDFQLSTSATSLTTGTWTDYDTLDFSSPIVAGTVGALNGNGSPSRTAITFTITGLSIPDGATFWIRWTDADLIPGADDGLAIDDFSLTPAGADAAPAVEATSPANSATGVALDANVTVAFSEPVNASGTWFAISCSTSGAHTAAVSGGPKVFTLNPAADFAFGDSCTVTVYASLVSDQDANDPPDTMASDFSWSFSPLASDPAPSVAATIPAHSATGVALDANVTVTFSEPVNVSGEWFGIVCSATGAHAATVSGGPTTFTLDPVADFSGLESCTVSIVAARVSDQDVYDPPDTMASDYVSRFNTATATPADPCAYVYTPIFTIQGSGPEAAVTGPILTKGVVVGDFEGPSPALRGFFIQDAAGDANPATSDGIFVFNGNNNHVSPGDVVRVAGTAGEFQGQTQISAASILSCGTGAIAPANVTFPLPSAAFLEQYEGMLVRLPQTMYVTEHYQLGRFGEILLSANARLRQPTDAVLPGAPALALQAQNALNQILVDDELNNQNPDPIRFGRGGNPLSASNTLRGGDTATGVVGVMTYTWGGNAASPNAYRLRPVNALAGGIPDFQPANPRPAAAPDVGGTLRVAGMNLLNYFNTFDGSPDSGDNCTNGVGGASTDCRGADTAAEFDRQWPKTVAAIVGTGADIVGLIELENDGYGPASAIQDLVNRLNTATAPGTYAFVDVDANTGQLNALGTDAIKVGLLYRPANVTPVGATAALNSVPFVNGGDAEARNRPSLAQAFERNGTGGRLTVVVNHLKSKGSACDSPDALDGQGNCSIVRTNAVHELTAWLQTDPTGTNDADVLLVGDFNSYAMEDPIAAAADAGYANLISSFVGPDAYSYVFDGQWGYLDQALASSSLVGQVNGAAHWHINADEPSVLDYNVEFKSAGQLVSLYAPDQYRITDHDPVVIGLTLTNKPPTADAGGPYTVDEGSSILLSATGSDPDGTPVTYAWDLDDNGTYETPGQSVMFGGPDGPADYAVSVKVTDATGLSTVASALVHVNNVPPGLQVSLASQGVQYSDPITAATFTAVDVPSDIPLAPATSFKAGTGSFGPGLPDGLTLAAGACSATTCTWSLGGRVLVAPGTYVVRVTVTDKDGGSSTAETTIAVTPEDARAIYTGTLFASTGSPTSSVATVTLAATIQDISVTPDAAGDTWPGDIRNAAVTFLDRDNGNAILCTAPVGLVSAADKTLGAAACNAAINLGASDSLQARVGILVGGYYTRNSTTEDAVVTVSKAIGSNFITGGGYLLAEYSAGLNASTPGTRVNFGFNVKYNKNRTNLQGRINTIVRSGGRVYQVKGNLMTSLSVSPSPCPGATVTAPCAAVFNGKASIIDVTNPVAPLPVDGNAALQVTITDRGEPGSSDQIAVTVWSKAGGLWFTSRWDGLRAVEQLLAGGNLVVR